MYGQFLRQAVPMWYAEDIAAVAATTLADPQTHASRAYNLTGPEALTVAEAAAIISDETGQTIKHVDLDRDAWIAGAIANGIPPEYGAVLRQLTETIASGHGSRPNGNRREDHRQTAPHVPKLRP
jgi:uncharacterized protein YbjT (DUF2867 family)